jgi:hypothetical protein
VEITDHMQMYADAGTEGTTLLPFFTYFYKNCFGMNFRKIVLSACAVPILICVVIISGCKKTVTTTQTSQGTLSAVVGGSNYTASIVIGAYSSTYDVFAIAGYLPNGNDTSILQVNLPLSVPVNFPFNTDTAFAGIVYTQNNGAVEFDAEGGLGHAVIDILSWDSTNHKISGTFSGTLYQDTNPNDSVIITNGIFNTSYSVIN